MGFFDGNKWLIASGAAVAAFASYCVYFDHKRRSDPDYKKNVLRKRNMRQGKKKGSSSAPLPDMTNPADMQKYFLSSVQKGEELLASGDIDGGIEHLSNAIMICGQPTQLLNILQQTLAPQVFQLLLQRLPMVSQRMASAQGPSSQKLHDLQEEDLE